MTFQPGQSGNPLGRPKKPIDSRSHELQEFCKAHRDDIRLVGEIALEQATKAREPWAVKLCMEYFYPKPGTFVSISKEESREVNVNFMNALSHEDQQAFLKMWMRSKKGIPSFQTIDQNPDQCIDSQSTINNDKESEFIDINTAPQESD